MNDYKILKFDVDLNEYGQSIKISPKDHTLLIDGCFFIEHGDKSLCFDVGVLSLGDEHSIPMLEADYGMDDESLQSVVNHLNKGFVLYGELTASINKQGVRKVVYQSPIAIMVDGDYTPQKSMLTYNLIKDDVSRITHQLNKNKDNTTITIGAIAVITVAILFILAINGFSSHKGIKEYNAKQVSTALKSQADTQDFDVNPHKQASSSQTSPIVSASDVNPQNLAKHSQTISDETRKKVLADMGIDLDHLENLNNCVIE